MHIFHKWSRWHSTEINLVGADGGFSVSGQERWCKVCNKKQLRRV